MKLLEGTHTISHPLKSTENSSVSDDSASDTYQNSRTSTEETKQLKLKLTTHIKKLAKARDCGAIPAFRQRNYDYVKCGMVKMWLVDIGCGYDIVPNRETALIRRSVSKAKVRFFPVLSSHSKRTD